LLSTSIIVSKIQCGLHVTLLSSLQSAGSVLGRNGRAESAVIASAPLLDYPVRKSETTSIVQLVSGSCSNSITD
jgi:hypothetical protein